MHETFSVVHYTLLQWLFFFYFYSFLGWIWESGYASVVQKRPTNRGFLHGPIIPIYGFGALCVLISTIAVRDSIVLIFLFGMIGATVLELATGYGMERLFHVKYWDYSHFPFNYKGYICLFASLGWGLFSVLMIRVIHVPIEQFSVSLRPKVMDPILLVCTALTTVDAYQAFTEAMDLKDILAKISESKEYIRNMQHKLALNSAVQIEDFRKDLAAAAACHNPFELRRRFMQNLHELRGFRSRQLTELLAKAEEMLPEFPHQDELAKLKNGIILEIQKLGERGDKRYRRIASLLGRNPHAISKEYAEVMRELKDLFR